jgi:hypothetical protein
MACRGGHYYEPRWASIGVWDVKGLEVAGDPEPLTMDHEAVREAAAIIRKVIR